MLKIAIVESEETAKEAIFQLSKVLDDEFSFQYFDRISALVRLEYKDFDLIVLDSKYNVDRVHEALSAQQHHCVYLYLCMDCETLYSNDHGQIFFVHKQDIYANLIGIQVALNKRLSKHHEYLFAYDGVQVRLKYHDIYYIEKDDKSLVYYTKKGEFAERAAIHAKTKAFEPYGFVLINSGTLVNYEYIFKFNGDSLELHNHKVLRISRSKKAKVVDFIQKMTDSSK